MNAVHLALDYLVEFPGLFWAIYFVGQSDQKELNADQVQVWMYFADTY